MQPLRNNGVFTHENQCKNEPSTSGSANRAPACAGGTTADPRSRANRPIDTRPPSMAAEAAALLPLRGQAFEARRVEVAKATSLSPVRFDGNVYSVPTDHAHQAVTAVGGIDEVRRATGTPEADQGLDPHDAAATIETAGQQCECNAATNVTAPRFATRESHSHS